MENDDGAAVEGRDAGSVGTVAPVAVPVVVLGAGFVGLASAVSLAIAGYTGIVVTDTNAHRVADHCARIASGGDPLSEPGMGEALSRGGVRIADTADLSGAVVICAVGTPIASDGMGIDDRYVLAAAHAAARAGAALFVVRSTVTPRTIGPVRRALGAVPLVVVPEFLREGHAVYDASFPSRCVVGADDPAWVEWARHAFGSRCQTFPMSPEEAALVKISANTALSVRAWLANAVGDLAAAIPGGDARRVLQAVYADARLGAPGTPGLGAGGPCLPKDTAAFSSLIPGERVVREVREEHRSAPVTFAHRVRRWLPRGRQHLFAVAGVGFKPDSCDWRDSPVVELVVHMLLCGERVHLRDDRLSDGEWAALAQHVNDSLPHGSADRLTHGPVWPRNPDVIVLATDADRRTVGRHGQIEAVCGFPLEVGVVIADPYALLTAEDRGRLPLGQQYVGGGVGV